MLKAPVSFGEWLDALPMPCGLWESSSKEDFCAALQSMAGAHLDHAIRKEAMKCRSLSEDLGPAPLCGVRRAKLYMYLLLESQSVDETSAATLWEVIQSLERSDRETEDQAERTATTEDEPTSEAPPVADAEGAGDEQGSTEAPAPVAEELEERWDQLAFLGDYSWQAWGKEWRSRYETVWWPERETEPECYRTVTSSIAGLLGRANTEEGLCKNGDAEHHRGKRLNQHQLLRLFTLLVSRLYAVMQGCSPAAGGDHVAAPLLRLLLPYHDPQLASHLEKHDVSHVAVEVVWRLTRNAFCELASTSLPTYFSLLDYWLVLEKRHLNLYAALGFLLQSRQYLLYLQSHDILEDALVSLCDLSRARAAAALREPSQLDAKGGCVLWPVSPPLASLFLDASSSTSSQGPTGQSRLLTRHIFQNAEVIYRRSPLSIQRVIQFLTARPLNEEWAEFTPRNFSLYPVLPTDASDVLQCFGVKASPVASSSPARVVLDFRKQVSVEFARLPATVYCGDVVDLPEPARTTTLQKRLLPYRGRFILILTGNETDKEFKEISTIAYHVVEYTQAPYVSVCSCGFEGLRRLIYHKQLLLERGPIQPPPASPLSSNGAANGGAAIASSVAQFFSSALAAAPTISVPEAKGALNSFFSSSSTGGSPPATAASAAAGGADTTTATTSGAAPASSSSGFMSFISSKLPASSAAPGAGATESPAAGTKSTPTTTGAAASTTAAATSGAAPASPSSGFMSFISSKLPASSAAPGAGATESPAAGAPPGLLSFISSKLPNSAAATVPVDSVNDAATLADGTSLSTDADPPPISYEELEELGLIGALDPSKARKQTPTTTAATKAAVDDLFEDLFGEDDDLEAGVPSALPKLSAEELKALEESLFDD